MKHLDRNVFLSFTYTVDMSACMSPVYVYVPCCLILNKMMMMMMMMMMMICDRHSKTEGQNCKVNLCQPDRVHLKSAFDMASVTVTWCKLR